MHADRIQAEIDNLRAKFAVLSEDRLPIDIQTFLEVDLGLDAIPFPDLTTKYQIEAAILQDFSGVYIDQEQMLLLNGPVWKAKRLRFSIAHELAHYFLHRDIPSPLNFATDEDYLTWTRTLNGDRYNIEQEANEFAGKLLVPKNRLQTFFEEFAEHAEKADPEFIRNSELRRRFAERIGDKFMVINPSRN